MGEGGGFFEGELGDDEGGENGLTGCSRQWWRSSGGQRHGKQQQKCSTTGLWWSKTCENDSRWHQCHRKKSDYDETGLD
jgi:hypothetical protein